MIYVLAINAGPSSLKYQLFDMEDEGLIAKGQVDRIGIGGSNIVQTVGDKRYSLEQACSNHIDAMNLVLDALLHPQLGALKSMDDIFAVGHRVLHGGEAFTASSLITQECMDAIRDNIDLGPLHNPANIMGIEACQAVMPNTPMIAVFDTAFHQTMPPKAYIYSIPYEYYEKYRIRRYGFHGTSHLYVSHEAAKFLQKPIEQLKIITCHLGNGSSLTAVDCGKAVDTTMGVTPLEGLTMGTRSGDIDPAIEEFICNRTGLTVSEFTDILNKESGLKGISGVSSDMRDLMAAAADGNPRAQLAYEIFIYKIKKYIGSFAAAMGGVDVIVFTAGIGENNPDIRRDVLSGLEFIGVTVDDKKNNRRSGVYSFSKEGSKVQALVVSTNEELVIARDALRIARELKA